MNAKTLKAEKELREAIKELGYNLTGLSVDQYEDGEGIIDLEVTVNSKSDDYRVK